MTDNTTDTQTDYVSETSVRARLMETLRRVAARADVTLSPEKQGQFERWVGFILDNAKHRHRLMTSRQYDDWVMGRKLCPGDHARYIGPDREEAAQNGAMVPRPYGQVGLITQVKETEEGRTIYFTPHEAVEPVGGGEKVYVTLQVTEHTPGWLYLERLVSMA
jgi:hypothetical protein